MASDPADGSCFVCPAVLCGICPRGQAIYIDRDDRNERPTPSGRQAHSGRAPQAPCREREAMTPKSKLNTKKIAKVLGADHRGIVAAKGGYFGAMQLVAEIHSRFRVPQGGGRPTDPHWTERRLVPLAPETLTRLGQIAKKLCEEQGIVIAPLQLAA